MPTRSTCPRSGASRSKACSWQNGKGIVATGGNVAANVVTANVTGVEVTGSSQVVGNAVYANGVFLNGAGIKINPPFSGAITKNNLFGNTFGSPFGGFDCGLENHGAIGVNAKNNYWGTATGPGAPPSDGVCNLMDGSTIHTPFATKPFAVKVLKP